MKRNALWIATYLAIYATALVLLARFERFDVEEPLLILVIAGGGFTLVAWLVTRGVEPLATPRMPPLVPLLAYTALILAYFTWGKWTNVGVKLLIFVAIPALLFRVWPKFRFNWGDARIAALMAVVLTLFQLAFGNGMKRIVDAGLSGWKLALAIIASLVWLSIEAGVVEEFFFRVLLQTRLEQATRSTAGGILLAALIFGLTHAPGLYLRTAATGESFTNPSLLMAIAYPIVVLSVVSIFLGVLWARTRNFLVIALIHGAADLIPNLVPTAKTLGLL